MLLYTLYRADQESPQETSLSSKVNANVHLKSSFYSSFMQFLELSYVPPRSSNESSDVYHSSKTYAHTIYLPIAEGAKERPQRFYAKSSLAP